jgi:hypothetical protein
MTVLDIWDVTALSHTLSYWVTWSNYGFVVFPPNLYFKVLITITSECDFIWGWDLYIGNKIISLGWAPSDMTDVFCTSGNLDIERMSCTSQGDKPETNPSHIVFWRNQHHLHIDFEYLAYRILRKYIFGV